MTTKKAKTATLPYVILRTYSAGCFAGELESREGQEGTLATGRRLWCWAGALSLSDLAAKGTAKPTECKFSAPVRTTLTQIIEVLYCTPEARASIEGVAAWSAK